MYISKLIIKGFRSYGPEGATIILNHKLAAFVGLNSSGKTAAMESLRKLFGTYAAEREIHQDDFHFSKDEDLDDIEEKTLSIEIQLKFVEAELDAVPHYFSHMVVDNEGEEPYLRVRLEASWKQSSILQDGEIESKVYFIKVAEGEEESEETKQPYPNHLRSLIQVFYVPAIRKPSEQIKYATGSVLYRVLRKIES